jgi:glycosyltransferase involved in cell wall biosynthesis
MRILIVHPVMTFLGGGERLCCDTIRALQSDGHELTVLSSNFEPEKLEKFFGYRQLFTRVRLMQYKSSDKRDQFGTPAHLFRHLRGQQKVLKQAAKSNHPDFDLVFSTQDPGYIPNLHRPVIQWGYFPKRFSFSKSLPRTMRSLPLRLHYQQQISRVGLVLAISHYSKIGLDREWKRPSKLLYPACNMVGAGLKRDLVVTTARAIPEKRLELLWAIARIRPKYEFVMLLTRDPYSSEYTDYLIRQAPHNGRILLDPKKEVYHSVLGEAKVYVHFLQNEHFGITVVEAMSASCVPIVHDSGGPAEIVDDLSGFRWRRIEEIPEMVDRAMKMAPSEASRLRAQEFNYERFQRELSSIHSDYK